MQLPAGSNQLDSGWGTEIISCYPTAYFGLISMPKITPLAPRQPQGPSARTKRGLLPASQEPLPLPRKPHSPNEHSLPAHE